MTNTNINQVVNNEVSEDSLTKAEREYKESSIVFEQEMEVRKEMEEWKADRRKEHLKYNVVNLSAQLENFLVDDFNYDYYTIPKEIDAKIKSHAIWLKTKGKKGVRLDLTGQFLDGGYYAGLNLRKAILKDIKADLCNFNHTIFSGADMSGANLVRSTFNAAQFKNTNLSRTRVWNSSFDGANIYKANLTDSNIHTCTFYHANIEKACFVGAILKNLNCSGSYLGSCNFKYATLNDIGLVEAYVDLGNTWERSKTTNLVYAEGKVFNELQHTNNK